MRMNSSTMLTLSPMVKDVFEDELGAGDVNTTKTAPESSDTVQLLFAKTEDA